MREYFARRDRRATITARAIRSLSVDGGGI
jgi:hypothetical protein